MPGAAARGSTPRSCGYGATADGHHITTPPPGGIGAVRAARRALEKAGLDADRIDLVSAHATSTPEGDPTELMAINTLVGERARDVSVTATKSSIGHTLGAAGAVAAVATVKALEDGIVPPTLNLVDPDEHAGALDLTPLRARQSASCDVALVNAFGFGGQNAAVVLRALGRLMAERQTSPTSSPWSTASRACWSARPCPSSRSRAAGITVILRTPAALLPPALAAGAGLDEPRHRRRGLRRSGRRAARPRMPSSAPLTGVFYRSPSPGAEPYVREGGPVNAGQVIGLIEAMKLFNEIKSDVTGTVRHLAAGDGDLVKARQTLIEVDPA